MMQPLSAPQSRVFPTISQLRKASSTHAILLALWLTLGFLLCVRLWMMVTLPLTDSTEARYGDISRLIVAQGYWLMPHVDAQTPFFAKPPLSMWLSAGSATIFGVNEFALRLPHLLVTLSAMWALWLAMTPLPSTVRAFGLLVFAASPLAFVSAGAVMTDASQMACVTWAMLAAWRVLSSDPHAAKWRTAFWIAAAIGAMVKGLAALALIGLPLALFAVSGGGVLRVARALLRGRDVAIFALLVLPWYVAAERAYPGFLQYFLVGEHIMRFVQPNWAGDRYGYAHNVAWGSIWAYWAVAVLPWLGIFAGQLWAVATPSSWRIADEQTRWWWCWVLAPLLFFTFSRNLIWTYALTSIAPFALIAAHGLVKCDAATQSRRLLMSVAGVPLLYAVVAWQLPQIVEQRSARALVAESNRLGRTSGQPIIVGGAHPFSTRYYTNGEWIEVKSVDGFVPYALHGDRWMIVPNDQIEALGRALETRARLQVIKRQERASLVRALPYSNANAGGKN
jgi:4-amino-4-deoxy-L-arabinose transferase-like glycosyltransferase